VTQVLDGFLNTTTRITILLMVLWSLAISGSTILDRNKTQQSVVELARAEARGVFNKDLAYRRWAAQHGGVYVPITADTPANPHLDHVVERDITLPSGRPMTLMNPAYMTRQVHELSAAQYGLRGHITSLKPLRPENAPDDWEKLALERFETGLDEYSEIGLVEGEAHLRLMRPMLTEAGCLKCHADQGYEVGDIRGGVSVSVPMAPYDQVAREQLTGAMLVHGGIWLFGLIGLGAGGSVVRRRNRARRNAEIALARSEALYEDLFDSAPVPYFTMGADGRILSVNKAAAAFTGYGQGELQGMPIKDLYAEASFTRAKELFEKFIRGIPSTNEEMTYRTKDGEEVVGLLSVAPILDDKDQVIRSRSVVLDITNHKRLEEQLHASQRMEAIGRLAGGVAHDFNNLLTIIITYAEFLASDVPAQGQLKEDIQAIEDAANKAAQLTSQLLTFSSHHAQDLEVLAPVEVVEDLTKLLKRVLSESIELAVHLPEGIGLVRADRSQLEQIVINLAVNARDAMPDGGHLTIEMENIDLDEAFSQAHADVTPGPYVMLSVSDDGEGMDADTRSKIFEPFFTTKEVGKGTGLGLATVYGIVKQNGGEIWVYSEPGQGTTFKVCLPLVDEEATGRKSSLGSIDEMGGDEVILLVEDEDEVREATRRTLAKAGYEVLEAARGDEALVICNERGGTIHLLLTDVVMPGMGGAELAARFREVRPGAQVVFMSGYAANAVAQQGALSPDEILLNKPFSSHTLLQKIRKALEGVEGL